MTEEGGTVADRQVDGRPTVAFDLEVIAGPDAGKKLIVEGDRLIVGTSAVSDFVVTDPRVSRRHLALSVQNGRLRLEDLGSTNGTTVGSLRVREVFLSGGETLTLGRTTLRVGDSRVAAATGPRLDHFGRVLGSSPVMQRVYRLAQKVAASDISVVVTGETGTGKEQLGEAIHEASARAAAPFVVFDCTTVPPNLMEAALFGHEKGAFTGATQQRRGVFEQASGGTLFIDEIGDLEPTLQPKLLRALQRKEVQRVGGEKWVKADVRILAATRRDLEQEVQAGRFRDDLFYRLAVARIELPPLRDREGDVELIARAFWRSLGDAPYPGDLLARHAGYAWPGNVRELLNVVSRRHALGDEPWDEPLEPRAVGPGSDLVAQLARDQVPFSKARERVLQDFERRYVTAVLDAHGGNVTRAAEASGIGRRYFHMILARRSE